MAQMNKQVLHFNKQAPHHLSQMLSGTCAFLHSAFDLSGGEA